MSLEEGPADVAVPQTRTPTASSLPHDLRMAARCTRPPETRQPDPGFMRVASLELLGGWTGLTSLRSVLMSNGDVTQGSLPWRRA